MHAESQSVTLTSKWDKVYLGWTFECSVSAEATETHYKWDSYVSIIGLYRETCEKYDFAHWTLVYNTSLLT